MKIDARPFLERLVNEKSGDVVVCFKADNRDHYDYYILVEKGGDHAYASPLRYRYVKSSVKDFTPWRLECNHFQVDKVSGSSIRKSATTTVYLSNWGDDE